MTHVKEAEFEADILEPAAQHRLCQKEKRPLYCTELCYVKALVESSTWPYPSLVHAALYILRNKSPFFHQQWTLLSVFFCMCSWRLCLGSQRNESVSQFKYGKQKNVLILTFVKNFFSLLQKSRMRTQEGIKNIQFPIKVYSKTRNSQEMHQTWKNVDMKCSLLHTIYRQVQLFMSKSLLKSAPASESLWWPKKRVNVGPSLI